MPHSDPARLGARSGALRCRPAIRRFRTALVRIRTFVALALGQGDQARRMSRRMTTPKRLGVFRVADRFIGSPVASSPSRMPSSPSARTGTWIASYRVTLTD